MVKRIIAIIAVLLWSGAAFAAHPLITDDTGTQGKRKFQLEVNGEYLNVSGNTTTELSATFSAGITDNLDLVVGLPYQFLSTKDEDGNRTTEKGMADASIELKWRLFEINGLSLALKPGVTLPSGDDEKGIGAGRATYSLFFITTKEAAPWVFHFNLGYTRSENMHNERKDIYHASLASEFEAVKNLKVVANIGRETNTDKGSNAHPIFLLGGVIYSFTENIDMDFGIKTGLNKAGAGYTLLAGLTYRL